MCIRDSPKTGNEATWIWMDEAQRQGRCAAEKHAHGDPSAGRAPAVPGPIDDDAWMSLPPHQDPHSQPPANMANGQLQHKPWPAWHDVDDSDDGS
eukprot:876848-Prorocentrum_lima.AAC.1